MYKWSACSYLGSFNSWPMVADWFGSIRGFSYVCGYHKMDIVYIYIYKYNWPREHELFDCWIYHITYLFYRFMIKYPIKIAGSGFLYFRKPPYVWSSSRSWRYICIQQAHVRFYDMSKGNLLRTLRSLTLHYRYFMPAVKKRFLVVSKQDGTYMGLFD